MVSHVCGAENDTTSPALLLLYEFEAKARLDDPDTERVLDRAMCLPQAEPKLFEAIAGKSLHHFALTRTNRYAKPCYKLTVGHILTLILLCLTAFFITVM